MVRIGVAAYLQAAVSSLLPTAAGCLEAFMVALALGGSSPAHVQSACMRASHRRDEANTRRITLHHEHSAPAYVVARFQQDSRVKETECDPAAALWNPASPGPAPSALVSQLIKGGTQTTSIAHAEWCAPTQQESCKACCDPLTTHFAQGRVRKLRCGLRQRGGGQLSELQGDPAQSQPRCCRSGVGLAAASLGCGGLGVLVSALRSAAHHQADCSLPGQRWRVQWGARCVCA